MAKIIGVPREHRQFEYRVGLVPNGVALLTEMGHQVYVETRAGIGSGFSDEDYEKAGARIAFSKDEVFRRADLLLKVQRPTEEEVSWIKDGQTVMAFMMMANVPSSRLNTLEEKGIVTIAYELIEDEDGGSPVMHPLSVIGGKMTAQIAAHYLLNNKGGTGTLLGSVPGIPAAEVAIIGAGVVGMNAAGAFLGVGASVTLMDIDLRKIQAAHQHFNGRVTTMVAYPFNIKRVCPFVDVMVSAVKVPGQPAPKVITREMVRKMHRGAVIIDMSIDQGGSVETSRLTFHDEPTFVVDDVIHYCVPNIPGIVGRTATHAFLNVAWEYIQLVASEGTQAALEKSPALRKGIVTGLNQLNSAKS